MKVEAEPVTTLKGREIQKGIALGERAVREGRVYSQAEAKRLLSKYHTPTAGDAANWEARNNGNTRLRIKAGVAGTRRPTH